MSMTAEQVKQRAEQIRKETEALAELWRSVIDSYCPDMTQFRVWRNLHSFETVVHGITRTGKRFNALQGQMEPDYLVKYASKTMNNLIQRVA